MSKITPIADLQLVRAELQAQIITLQEQQAAVDRTIALLGARSNITALPAPERRGGGNSMSKPMRMRGRRPWTAEEDAKLRTLVAAGKKPKLISEQLGRPAAAIYSRKYVLGLGKPGASN